ncbi:YafY family transcriptional regulator [Candidatus Methylopumilus planktonicus]|uniref:helix-turn-helix transcriptional regulator n=1 Tax=Candidatus Methylopumilus planktonicus TaxID=1581557 RepID=UPI001124CB09|nr:YafY family protein [Candidatus Methylopumilus planktonicus]QDD06740.1 YafY family transcriptional regulator [Candidatus Methylopumilus planktonicus]QDD08076.1 YafY family transcriptional regulator [Candidatus Methylopumilus planktonicus]
MSNRERIYKIDQILNNKQHITMADFIARLEVSKATVKRDLQYMRDNLNAPIIYDRDSGIYRFESQKAGMKYELPGLWFSAEEIHALMTMQHLLAGIDSGGLLGPHIQPLLARLTGILGSKEDSMDEINKRIKVEVIGNRKFNLEHFQIIGSALLKRKRLIIDYHARSTDQTTTREISPQRLVYYKGNWYLDAWCHLKGDIRSFSVDSIKCKETLETKAEDIPDKKLDETLSEGYGIFSGSNIQWVKLKFTPERARWVASEKWHPKQKGDFLDDGSYQLSFPYSQDPELIMDIMKYGSDVKVVEPKALKEKIHKILIEAVRNY